MRSRSVRTRLARVSCSTRGAVGALLPASIWSSPRRTSAEEFDVEGTSQAFVTDHLDLVPPSLLRRALVWIRLALDRRRWNRQSIAHHYDRPPEFFLAWLDSSRSYTHGMFATPDEDLGVAQGRKLQFAIDALGVRPGMDVLDMGWAGDRSPVRRRTESACTDYALARPACVRLRAHPRQAAAVQRRMRRFSRLPARGNIRRRRVHGKPRAHAGLRLPRRFLARHLTPRARVATSSPPARVASRVPSCASTSSRG